MTNTLAQSITKELRFHLILALILAIIVVGGLGFQRLFQYLQCGHRIRSLVVEATESAFSTRKAER